MADDVLRDALGQTFERVGGGQSRIVSLVPSITELLFDLELSEQVVGRTSFCVHPADKVKAVPSVGTPKKLDLDKLRELAPTHVLLCIDETTKDMTRALRPFVPNIVVTHPIVPRDNLDLYRLVGAMFNRVSKAEGLCYDFENAFRSVATFAPRLPERRVLYLVWKEPWMAVSRNTYIGRMLDLVRWRSLIDDPKVRYPQVEVSDKLLRDADIIFLATEPYRFGGADIEAFKKSFDCKGKVVRSIDGALVSWYGSRAIPGLKYLRETAAELK